MNLEEFNCSVKSIDLKEYGHIKTILTKHFHKCSRTRYQEYQSFC